VDALRRATLDVVVPGREGRGPREVVVQVEVDVDRLAVVLQDHVERAARLEAVHRLHAVEAFSVQRDGQFGHDLVVDTW
jgi:hypothetical protein